MDFIKMYLEEHWQSFLSHLQVMGIPYDECEQYAEELLKKLADLTD